MATTEPIRSKEQLTALAEYFHAQKNYRNYVLVVMGAHTALRIGDLLKLCWQDVYDANREVFRKHIFLDEQKTDKGKAIALNEKVVEALSEYYPCHAGEYIFESRKRGRPISRVQAYRIIRDACVELGIDGKIACHSLRKTWGYHAWTSGEVSPVVIMEVYNHSSYDITKRYLGIQQDDLDEAYLRMKLFDDDEKLGED